MKILSFRVRKYRNIEDSNEIKLLDNLTCIVGKNQSGKTAILRALYKFNPHEPDPYDMRREWPRGQRTSRNSKQIVCEVRFELTDCPFAEMVLTFFNFRPVEYRWPVTTQVVPRYGTANLSAV